MFMIATDAAANIIHTSLSGFLSLEDVAAYAAEVEPIIRRCAAQPGGYRILVDVSGCAIQAQDVIVAFQQHVARVPQSRRLAVVASSALARMQLRRVMSGPHMDVFAEREAALAWLQAATAQRADD